MYYIARDLIMNVFNLFITCVSRTTFLIIEASNLDVINQIAETILMKIVIISFTISQL